MAETIEDIILAQDQRGVSQLRGHLPPDFCAQAAQYVLDNPGPALIATGFYILSAGKPETDGPPGAIAIGDALRDLGRQVAYVTDRHSAPAMRQWLGGRAEVVEFPILDVAGSRRETTAVLERVKPRLVISIERCGRTGSDTYLNMRYRDITEHTARLDYFFEAGVPSVGIGDGGNEIGMGNLIEVIPSVDSLPDDPAVSRVDRLIIASVSNWGGYGLAAALSQLTGKHLLPAAGDEALMVQGMIDAGAVDGTTGDAVPTVDNFSMDENGELLARLHRLVNAG